MTSVTASWFAQKKRDQLSYQAVRLTHTLQMVWLQWQGYFRWLRKISGEVCGWRLWKAERNAKYLHSFSGKNHAPLCSFIILPLKWLKLVLPRKWAHSILIESWIWDLLFSFACCRMVFSVYFILFYFNTLTFCITAVTSHITVYLLEMIFVYLACKF